MMDDAEMEDAELMERFTIEELEDRETFYSVCRDESEAFQDTLDMYMNEY